MSSEIVSFFLHSLAGCSYLHWCWRALGRAPDVVQSWSIRLFYCQISSMIPRYSLKTRLSFEFLCCSCDRQTEKEKTMPAPTKKRCTSCGKEKSLSDFYHNVTKSDRHNSICKDCQKLSNATNKARKNLPNF